MGRGLVTIFNGEGHGKSSAALGRAVLAAASGEKVFIIRFLKGKNLSNPAFFNRLEPEIKIFCFEKSVGSFAELSDQQKADEIANIRNGLNFAKKVIATGECDLLILDEILGLIDNDIITVEDLKNILLARDEDMSIILTGIHLPNEIAAVAGEVSRVEGVKIRP